MLPFRGLDKRSFFISGHFGKIMQIGGMDVQQEMYDPDKPRDCSLCYFWINRQAACSLGKGNCYYKIKEQKKIPTECDGCPYGRHHPCIGWCTKKILRELNIR